MSLPLLIAHRGGRNNFQENTIEAFAAAFEKGADGVELDIHLLNDQLIVVHDFTYNRSGHYPLLKEVLEQFGQKGRLEVEIKAFSTDILKPLRRLVDEYQPIDLEITTGELPLVGHITGMFPDVFVGVNFNQCHYRDWMNEELYLEKTVQLMKLMKAQVAHVSNLPEEKVTKTLVDGLHKHDLKIHYHIEKKELSEQLQLVNMLGEIGVDQCTFDDIELMDVKKAKNT